MLRQFLLIVLLGTTSLTLAACGDGNPFDDTDPDDDGDTGPGRGLGAPGTSQTDPAPDPVDAPGSDAPLPIAHNLHSVAYDPAGNGGAGTLLVDLRSLDASVHNARYRRAPERDIPGYRAFMYQETADVGTASRVFLAYVARSDSGDLTAATVGDGGQFNLSYGGNVFDRDSDWIPASGMAGFEGDYAGVITVDTAGGVEYYNDDAPLPSAIYPYRPASVVGQVLIIADFTNQSINGTIYNRDIVEESYILNLPDEYDLVDLALVGAAIDGNGAFTGRVEELNAPGTGMGVYGGILAGNAGEVAGAIFIQPYTANSNIFEHGIFVLNRCDGSNCPTP